jgi:hypothetical protein
MTANTSRKVMVHKAIKQETALLTCDRNDDCKNGGCAVLTPNTATRFAIVMIGTLDHTARLFVHFSAAKEVFVDYTLIRNI